MSLTGYFGQAGAARRLAWTWVGSAIIAATLGSWVVLRKWPTWSGPTQDKRTYVNVQPITLDITIRQNGELQSINNIDINCPVQGQNTIQQIVPEGTNVKKGEVIAILDSTEHRRNLETA